MITPQMEAAWRAAFENLGGERIPDHFNKMLVFAIKEAIKYSDPSMRTQENIKIAMNTFIAKAKELNMTDAYMLQLLVQMVRPQEEDASEMLKRMLDL